MSGSIPQSGSDDPSKVSAEVESRLRTLANHNDQILESLKEVAASENKTSAVAAAESVKAEAKEILAPERVKPLRGAEFHLCRVALNLQASLEPLEEELIKINLSFESIQESFRKAVDGYKREINRSLEQGMNEKPWIR